ncbi:MAG TPA: PQQ-binding-like beta-propeller repeat protein [Bryobacterales bacterium]|nr:PQQ-binding-like beta-propeller repeat protein [Bryobacterales bacterium]
MQNTWTLLAGISAALAVCLPNPAAQPAASPAPARDAPAQFRQLCSGCHGDKAAGTERGPALADNRSLRRRSEKQIQDLIRNGAPPGMPPFRLPENELEALAAWVHSLNASVYDLRLPGDPAAGERFFFGKGQCASCHMVRGRGRTNGPDLSDIGRQLTLAELEQALDDPSARAGSRSSGSCPPWAWCPQDTWSVARVRLRNGSVLRGFARNQGKHDLQLQTFDGWMHLLLDTEYDEVSREKGTVMPALHSTAEERRNLIAYLARLGGVPTGPLTGEFEPAGAGAMESVLRPPPGDWPTYNGDIRGNRHSALRQITTENANRLQLQWTYTLPYIGLEMTPVVSGGVMYVSAPNRICALDSRTGREIWCYSRPRSAADTIAGDAAKGANRGVAVLGDWVYFATDNAHLICLHRLTGALIWDVVMPEGPGRYGATAAPLVVGDLVISGVSGGDGPLRGFLAAYNAGTGRQVWRFWTVPQRGQPGSETWRGSALETGGGATWLTGSYDPETGLLFWPTGNPFPDTDGDQRAGDNLYTNCVLALEAKTGKLRWYYQFTPHDLHDWDATEPLVLVNAMFHGRERKLLLQANRSGFFYVLDRTTGEFLLGKPFVRRLTWASGIGAGGRPHVVEGNKPTPAGTKTCPAVRGATNWYATTFNPETKLFYVMAIEDCNIYRQSEQGGYVPLADPSSPPEKFLRAIDIETGKIAWEIPQVGPPEANYSGVLSTAGGLVFYGETGGGFAAVEAKSGKTLWHFETGQQWRASPMTYMAGGRQYVAVASGSNVLAFALPGR